MKQSLGLILTYYYYYYLFPARHKAKAGHNVPTSPSGRDYGNETS